MTKYLKKKKRIVKKNHLQKELQIKAILKYLKRLKIRFFTNYLQKEYKMMKEKTNSIILYIILKHVVRAHTFQSLSVLPLCADCHEDCLIARYR